ncbi:MAG: hypothetical protein IPI67_36280 [Myxococcales bacterium]|nr:hypothetical protein [Myxococcales bacterium]
MGSGRWTPRIVLVTLAGATGCSVLAPSDDEFLGGGQNATGGKSGSGGASNTGGVTATGGSSTGGGGTSGGGTAGTGATGGTAGTGATGGTAGTGATGGTAGTGATGGTTGTGATGGTTGTGATGGTAGTGATGGTAGTGATGGTAGTGATGGSGGSGGATCTPGTSTAKAKPVALYAIVDHSTSMVASGDWQNIVGGVNQYVDLSSSAGVSLGLHFFPFTQGNCSGSGFSNPAVPIALLPGNASAIKSALGNPPSGSGLSDPMDGIIQGGISACKTFAAANPDKQCNFVLVSDYSGNNSCPSSSGALSSMLQNAVDNAPSVMTYVIRAYLQGTTVLNQFAAAGGTGSASYASSAASMRDGFQRAASPCRFELPNSGTGTVTWQVNGSVLSQVSGPAGCGGQNYYLTSNAMVLCPNSCAGGGGNQQKTVTSTVVCNGP